MSRRRLAILTLGLLLTMSLFAPASVQASHHTYWFHVKAPFTGYWDRHNGANPWNHPAYGYDWATDFYQSPGTLGKWYASASDGGSITVKVDGNPTYSCDASTWTTAGLRYKFGIYRGTTLAGYWQYTHVDPRIPGTGNQYWLSNGASLTNGMNIGWTYFYTYLDDCWEVNYSNGVHWHIAGYNIVHYSCYYPHSWGTLLSQGSGVLGVVNSNATGTGQACY